jgi:hypothetical protein
LIRLVRHGEGALLVTALAGERADPGFSPFPLPPLPLSQHCWLTGLGAEFLGRHERCLAALLVLDCVERRWVRPVLPAQTCGRDGTCWTLDLGDDGPLPVPRRVAGSFQVRAATDVMDAASSVPHLDGLHIVQAAQAARDGQAVVYCFLHFDGETAVALPESVFADDWEHALREAADRMTFD